jgi:hypothetical protein
MSHLELVALLVRDYDAAIDFFVNVLQFEIIEDVPSLTNDGRPKRWVVVRPVGGVTGILLARADGDHQAGIVGKQFAGRVGFFLRVDRILCVGSLTAWRLARTSPRSTRSIDQESQRQFSPPRLLCHRLGAFLADEQGRALRDSRREESL